MSSSCQDPTHFVISPLAQWDHGETELPRGALVKHIDTIDTPDFEVWNHFLSGREIDEITQRPYWLVSEVQEPAGSKEERKKAFKIVRQTWYALQICTPLPDDGVILCYSKSGSDLLWDSSEHRQTVKPTTWANIVGFHGLEMDELRVCAEGVHQAFEKKIVRLQTPIQLLEQGLQHGNLHIRLLLWCVGLDALLVAHDQETFARRLCNLLGADRFVFPESDLGQRPNYRVQDVARDVYALRSIIAHGNEIPSSYRQVVGFDVSGPHGNVGGNPNRERREVLHECSLYLLCGVLREIFKRGLVTLVSNSSAWANYLDRVSQ